MSASPLTVAEAARIMREHPEAFNCAQLDLMRDKSYQRYPMGEEAAAYLRSKRKRLTDSSFRDYEACLDKFARYFWGVQRLADFEPPVGTERLEEFLDHQWGTAAPRTYNKNLSIVRDFFKFQLVRGHLHGDPTMAIARARSRNVERTTFAPDQLRAIVAQQEDLRDRVALRLLLDYGLRKGALQRVQFKHFDHYRKRLTIFTKGRKVREVPLPDTAFWFDLERLIVEQEAQPGHYLMCRQKTIPRAGVRRFPELAMGAHGLHSWWYRCLENAGVAHKGQTSGERMHKARHTAGQRVLDATGNLKAVQKLLGHTSIQTTADIYVDWDLDALAATMAQVLDDAEERP